VNQYDYICDFNLSIGLQATDPHNLILRYIHPSFGQAKLVLDRYKLEKMGKWIGRNLRSMFHIICACLD